MTSSMKDYLTRFEQDHPGTTRRLWEACGAGYTKADDATCAAAMTQHIALTTGERVDITPSAWSDHRMRLNIVSHHRQAREVTSAVWDALASEAVVQRLFDTLDSLTHAVNRLALATERQLFLQPDEIPVRYTPPQERNGLETLP